MNFLYFAIGFSLIALTTHIVMKVLYPWTSEMPHRWWLVFASACGITGMVLIVYALVHTFGWLGAGLFVLSGVLINIKHYQVVRDWAAHDGELTFDTTDNRDPLDEAP